MLTYSQIQQIAGQLGWSIREVEQSIAQLAEGFMQPEVIDMMADEAAEATGDCEATEGYYYRLSAPGYLDCTDWSGPFESEEDAVADMLQTYAD